jgi:hypothetical protein
MDGFVLWLEAEEIEGKIRDQLAAAMNMQANKDSLNQLDIEAFREPVTKALDRSKATLMQMIPPERYMAAQQWVRTVKGANIGKLVGILSGRESFDATVPAAPKPPKVSPQPVAVPGTAPPPPMPGVQPQ